MSPVVFSLVKFPRNHNEIAQQISNEFFLKNADKSVKARWYCAAQFDLFFPEPQAAPHIVYHSQISGMRFSFAIPENRIFDIDRKYIIPLKEQRDVFSKLI